MSDFAVSPSQADWLEGDQAVSVRAKFKPICNPVTLLLSAGGENHLPPQPHPIYLIMSTCHRGTHGGLVAPSPRLVELTTADQLFYGHCPSIFASVHPPSPSPFSFSCPVQEDLYLRWNCRCTFKQKLEPLFSSFPKTSCIIRGFQYKPMSASQSS